MNDYKQYIRKAIVHDVYNIANDLREADKNEAYALGYDDPAMATIASFLSSSTCITLLSPDRWKIPIVLIGVTPSPHEGMGFVWLVSTPDIEDYPIRFLRHCHSVLGELFDGYDALYNYVHTENSVHIKWLHWLGFTFLREVKGQRGNFYEFIKLKER